jgi:MoaA/NifB/PqqE/SkfB family radical SAM enzyme
MRKPQWWKKFGEILKSNSQNWVTFSIDGLEDTNHIYRRNVVWNKLIENVQEYISSGAYAVWDFLIFKHNEHQIDQAKDLAKTLGFKEFVPKKALGVDDGEYLKPMVALNKEGQLEYIIEAPTNPKNRNLEDPIGTKQYQEFPFTKEEYEKNRETKFLVKLHNKRSAAVYDDIKHKNYTNQDSCQIKCKSFQTQGVEVFIDNFGNVLPCCYVGTRINGRYSDHGTLQLHHEMNKYGFEKFNLNTFSIKEILDAQHLDRVFADSWNKESINSGKLLYCAETCGTYSALDKILTHEDRERFK